MNVNQIAAILLLKSLVKLYLFCVEIDCYIFVYIVYIFLNISTKN